MQAESALPSLQPFRLRGRACCGAGLGVGDWNCSFGTTSPLVPGGSQPFNRLTDLVEFPNQPCLGTKGEAKQKRMLVAIHDASALDAHHEVTMYKSITFPTVATGAVQFDGFTVSVDPTFACVVVEHAAGHEVFTYDEATSEFVFVCSTLTAHEPGEPLPQMEAMGAALDALSPWLVDETIAVRTAWFDFFGGVRQLPSLTAMERRHLDETRMRLVSGVQPTRSARRLSLV